MTILELFEKHLSTVEEDLDDEILGALIRDNEDVLNDDVSENVEAIYFKDVGFSIIKKIVEDENYPITSTYFIRVEGDIDLSKTNLLSAYFEEIRYVDKIIFTASVRSAILKDVHIREIIIDKNIDFLYSLSLEECIIENLSIDNQEELLELHLFQNKIKNFDVDEVTINGMDTFDSSGNSFIGDAEGDVEVLRRYFLTKHHLNNKSDRRGEASISDTGLFDFKN